MPRPVGFRFTHCRRGHKLTKKNVKLTTRGTRECLICIRLRNKKNRERILEGKRQWHRRNSKRINAKRREVAKLPENKEKYKKYSAANYLRNKKKIKERVSVWAKANPEKVKASQRRHVQKYSEYYNQKHREWMKAHPEVGRASEALRKARKLGNGGEYTHKEFIALKKKYGNRCLCCGLHERSLRKLGRKLVADHVIPLSKGGRNSIENLQPLCHGPKGCNNKKTNKTIDYRTK